jgi:hypothetical protein
MAGEPAVGRLDCPCRERLSCQARQQLQARHPLERAEHGLAADGPAACLVDHVQRPPQITLAGQLADMRPVVAGGALQGSKAQALTAISTCEPGGDARAHAAVSVVQDRQPIGAGVDASHGPG